MTGLSDPHRTVLQPNEIGRPAGERTKVYLTADEIGDRAGKTKCTETEEFSGNLTLRYRVPAGWQLHGGHPGETTGAAGPWPRPRGRGPTARGQLEEHSIIPSHHDTSSGLLSAS